MNASFRELLSENSQLSTELSLAHETIAQQVEMAPETLPRSAACPAPPTALHLTAQVRGRQET